VIGGLASILVLISGFMHAIVTAILKSGKDKMSGRALIDAVVYLKEQLTHGRWTGVFAIALGAMTLVACR